MKVAGAACAAAAKAGLDRAAIREAIAAEGIEHYGVYRVSTVVNSPAHESPECLKPTP